ARSSSFTMTSTCSTVPEGSVSGMTAGPAAARAASATAAAARSTRGSLMPRSYHPARRSLANFARHRHEAHRQHALLLEALAPARHDHELLPVLADRHHQPATVLELLLERLR